MTYDMDSRMEYLREKIHQQEKTKLLVENVLIPKDEVRKFVRLYHDRSKKVYFDACLKTMIRHIEKQIPD